MEYDLLGSVERILTGVTGGKKLDGNEKLKTTEVSTLEVENHIESPQTKEAPAELPLEEIVGASPTPHIWLDCKAIEALLDERISKGKTVPAIKEKLLPIIDLINADCKISDDGIGKATALLVALIESIPEVKLFNEAVKKEEEKFIELEDDFMHYETDQEALKLHRKGIALSKEKGIPYIRAILEITAEARRR